MKKKLLLSVVLAACCFSLAWGQASNGTHQAAAGEQTLEQLYLNNPALRKLHDEATSLSRNSELLALSGIRNLIEQGKSAQSSAVAYDLLSMLAFEGTARVVTHGLGPVINNFPDVRREACSLLARLGGIQAVNLLLRVVQKDTDPLVLAEAVYGLGEIGYNKDDVVSETIARAVVRQDVVAPDNNFAFASLLAFEKLAKKNNGLADPQAFQAILQITQGSYIYVVKLKAARVLGELKTYG